MKKWSNSDIIFFSIGVVVGILSTICCVGIGMEWYNFWNPLTAGQSLIAWPVIIFSCLFIDFIIWCIVMFIIMMLFFDGEDYI